MISSSIALVQSLFFFSFIVYDGGLFDEQKGLRSSFIGRGSHSGVQSLSIQVARKVTGVGKGYKNYGSAQLYYSYSSSSNTISSFFHFSCVRFWLKINWVSILKSGIAVVCQDRHNRRLLKTGVSTLLCQVFFSIPSKLVYRVEQIFHFLAAHTISLVNEKVLRTALNRLF